MKASRSAAFLAALLAAAAAARGDDTPGFRFDPARRGATAEAVPPGLAIRWTASIGPGAAISTPVVWGGRVFVGSESGQLRALSVDDGSVLWTHQAGGAVRGSAAVVAGRVYVGSADGTLACLHAGTGEVLWSVFHGGFQVSSPLVVNGAVYFGAGDPTTQVRAVQALTGAPLWTANLGQPVMSSPAWHAASGRLIVGDNSGRWYALDGATGAVAWTYLTNAAGVRLASAAVEGDTAVFSSGGLDRALHVVDAWTGKDRVAPVPLGPQGSIGSSTSSAPVLTQALVSQDELFLLAGMAKPERDLYVDALAASDGFDSAALKGYLDQVTGLTPYVPGSDSSRSVATSSPAFSGGLALITQREYSGTGADAFYTVAVNAASGTVRWATAGEVQSLTSFDLVASPAVSAGAWAYAAHGRYLQIRSPKDGGSIAEVTAGSQILGGPVLANGRAYFTTEDGRVVACDTGNHPPRPPTSFSPAGGTIVASAQPPVLSWTGQSDDESAAPSLSAEVQAGLGNGDLDLSPDAPATLLPGESSLTLGPIAPNTHVWWRVRVRDASGAYSTWSAVQDFWVARDLVPPEPPQGVRASARNGAVEVNWDPSPSADVARYRLAWKKSAEAWAQASAVENLAGGPYLVQGLTNGVPYDFMVTAIDQGENESTGVVVTAMPKADVTIGGTGSYATLQAAIDAAQPGETVVVNAGTYAETVVLHPGISLRGASARLTRLVGPGAGTVIRVEGAYGADGPSVISDLAVTGGATGIASGTADVLVRNVVVAGMGGDGVASAAGGRLRVVSCTLFGNAGSGVDASTAPGLTEVRNTAAGQNGGYGVQAAGGSIVGYNTSYQNGLGGYAPGLSGPGNLQAPALLAADFTELAGSPTIDAGDPTDDYAREPSPNGGRINVGAFGNTSDAAPTPAEDRSSSRGCGALGLEFLLLILLRRRRAR
jgi:outer membrane protein assembly factor BamB